MITNDNIISEIYGSDYTENTFKMLFYIIDRCNFKCSYCYNVLPRQNVEMNLDHAYDFIKKLYDLNKYNFIEIQLIGGETCLHPKLLEFCEKVHNLSSIFRFIIFSNFTQPLSIYQKLLEYNTELILTLHDNTNPEWFKEKIKLLDAEKCKKQIQIVIMYELNCWKESLAVFDYFYQNQDSFNKLNLSLIEIIGNNKLIYNDEQIKEYEKRIKKHKDIRTILKYKNGNIKQLSDNFFFLDNDHINFYRWYCSTGVEFLYIHFDGNIYLCDTIYGNPIGNICNLEQFKFPTHGIICPHKKCPCIWYASKKNIFNLDTPFIKKLTDNCSYII